MLFITFEGYIFTLYIHNTYFNMKHKHQQKQKKKKKLELLRPPVFMSSTSICHWDRLSKWWPTPFKLHRVMFAYELQPATSVGLLVADDLSVSRILCCSRITSNQVPVISIVILWGKAKFIHSFLVYWIHPPLVQVYQENNICTTKVNSSG